ncbi:MAG: hypothetical protein QNJ17_16290 [Desulfocapsaceae bacterium]|nr:hypothetical protein [Desulfocapsaceae bacterium]
MRICSIFIVLFCIFPLLPGCSLKIHQPVQSEIIDTNPSPESTRLLEVARDKFYTVDSREELLDSMQAFRNVLKIDPGNREAWSYICNQYILLGAAYTAERSLKRQYYREAMQSCELAMYTHEQFRQEMARGSKPWEAAHTLEAEDAPAMLFWVTALQYEFKEAMTLPSKIVNIRWLQHALVFLDRIEEVAPEFGNGAVEMAYSVCYCVLPGFYGGDEEKCYGYMEEAVSENDGYLLAKWGRGRYFHQVTGDTESAFRDLRWVAGQDLDLYNDPYPWKVYFQSDAKAVLTGKSEL